MSYEDIKNADIRLTILQLLAQDPGYDLNETILNKLLDDPFGHQLSKDALRTQLAWLKEQGLIEIRTVADCLQLAKLTTRGLDTAQGRATVPGVARPRPEDI